jgi:hypothetical protein
MNTTEKCKYKETKTGTHDKKTVNEKEMPIY